MKKTLTINLNGIVFNIDEDAYSLLNEYINNLNHAFSNNEDREEIISDIEAGICEILSEKITSNRNVINLKDIEEIITRMGRPEEFEIGDNENSLYKGNYKQNLNVVPPPFVSKPKKLFRNPLDKMLGGVCSGIGVYLNIDSTWVRLIFICICLLTITFAVGAYIILWIILPEAKNATDKLAMTGEIPTIENIGKTVKTTFEKTSDTSQQSLPNDSKENNAFKKVANRFFSVLVSIFKVIAIGIGIICIPVVFALALALIVCIFTLIIFSVGQGTMVFNSLPISWGPEPILSLLVAVGLILVIMIPLIFLSYVILKSSLKINMPETIKWIFIILLIVGFLMSGISIGLLTQYI